MKALPVSSGLARTPVQDLVQGRLENLQGHQLPLQPQTAGQAQKLQENTQEFASLFVLQALQAMRRTIPRAGFLEKGFAHDTYLSLFDQEIARQIARRETLGLGPLLQQHTQQGPRERQTQAPPGGFPLAREASALPLTPRSPVPQALSLSLAPREQSLARSIAPSTPALSASGHATGLRRHEALGAYKHQQPQGSADFLRPVDGHISSPFGMRHHPIDGDWHHHGGLDMAAPAGTPIRAAAAGQVLFSGVQRGYGNLVVIQHPEGYTTLYAHNAVNLVEVGERVTQGQPIATVGMTGKATGPHLHFEVRKDGERLDPVPFLALAR